MKIFLLPGVPALPTTPDTPGVHRSLLPKVVKLWQHEERGGGGWVIIVDNPPHCVTHMCNVVTRAHAGCDTNILMRHKSDSFCDKQAEL